MIQVIISTVAKKCHWAFNNSFPNRKHYLFLCVSDYQINTHLGIFILSLACGSSQGKRKTVQQCEREMEAEGREELCLCLELLAGRRCFL